MKTKIEQIVQAYGGPEKCAKTLELCSPAVCSGWKKRGLPAKLIIRVHRDTGISLDDLEIAAGLVK